MKKISSYIWDYKFSYLGAVLSLLVAVTLDMLAPRLTARVVDDVILGGRTGELGFLLFGNRPGKMRFPVHQGVYVRQKRREDFGGHAA